MKVLGFPTIYLFPALDKMNPIEYDGDRSVEAIAQFVEDFRSGGNAWNTRDHSQEELSDYWVDSHAATQIVDINGD